MQNSAVRLKAIKTGGNSLNPPASMSLNLLSGAISSLVSFTRATTGTVTDFEGLIKNVKSGEVRFDGMRRVENLLTYSQDFSNAVWVKSAATITADAIAAPDGTLTADKIVENSATATHFAYNPIAVNSGSFTFTVYAKAGERSWIYVRNTIGAYFNLSSGAIGTIDSGVNAAITSVGNGWYRCSVTSTQSAGTIFPTAFLSTANGTTNYAGDGTSGIYIWGAQLENVTGQANQNPSEYVSTNVLSAPYQGANVDGVQYFPYTNPNCIINGAITQIPTIAINSSNSKFAYNCVASGDYFSTPSSAANQITGDISLLVQVALDDWTPATVQTLVAKDGVSAGTRSWALNIQTSGAPRFNYSLDGTSIISVTASASTGFTDGTTHFVGVQREAATGIIRFYTSEDGTTFTLLGTQQTGTAGSLYNATSTQVQFGSLASSGFDLFGKIYDSHVYTGLKFTGSSTMVMDFDPSNWTIGSTFTGLETGEVWTLNGNAKIYQGLWDAVGPKSWLIEEARTNLLTYSDQFDNVIWSPSAVTITANNTVSPDGTLLGDKIIASATSANHLLNRLNVFTPSIGVSYTLSWYAKKSEYGYCRLQFQANGFPSTSWANFNLITGTVGLTGGTGTASIINVGNGWYRCVFTDTATANLATGVQPFVLSSDLGTASPSFLGDGTSGIYIWGAQLEAGSFATSYIPTTTAQVTRNGDQGSMTGTNFSSWYNASAGTVYTEGNYIVRTSTSGIVSFLETGTSYIEQNSSTTQFSAIASNGIVSNTTGHSNSSVGQFKFAMAYDASNVTSSLNGSSVNANSSGTMSPMVAPTTLRMGRGVATTFINGHIRTIRYYSQRLPNSTLQSLTA